MFDEAICSMMKYPTGSSSSTDSQKDFENENSIRLMPNPAQQTETQVPGPLRRSARLG